MGSEEIVGPKDDLMSGLTWLGVMLSCLGLLGVVAWIVADQFVAECTAPVAPTAHAAQECVQHNQGAVVFLLVALAVLLLISVASIRGRSVLSSEGIRRRELFGDRLYPWAEVQSIRTRRGSGARSIFRVEAVRIGGRRAVMLGQFSDPAAADAWASYLTGWLAGIRAEGADRQRVP